MQAIAGTPQTKSLTTLLMAAIVSKNMGESILSGVSLYSTRLPDGAQGQGVRNVRKNGKKAGKNGENAFITKEKNPPPKRKVLPKKLNYAFFCASSTATATATVAPTIGLLPMPIRPIISTCAGTEEEPANWASECIRPMVSVMP